MDWRQHDGVYDHICQGATYILHLRHPLSQHLTLSASHLHLTHAQCCTV